MTEVTLRARKKTATRARIVSAAVDLFSEHGIEAVTVDDIALAADVGKGTIYNYFRAKEDIVLALLLDLDRAAFADLPALAEDPADLAAILDLAAWRIMEAKAGRHLFVRAFFQRLFAADILEALEPFQVEFDAAVAALLRRLQARGLVDPALDVPAAVLTFKVMHMGLSALWALEGPPFATARVQTCRQMGLLAREIAP